MGFVIEKVGNRRNSLPEGFYVVLEGIEYRVNEITISASGKVCMKIWDPLRKESQIKTLCSLEELINATIPGGIFKEN
jgi:hypothetical protein